MFVGMVCTNLILLSAQALIDLGIDWRLSVRDLVRTAFWTWASWSRYCFRGDAECVEGIHSLTHQHF